MKQRITSFLCLGLLMCIPLLNYAQCAMCSATAESSLESGSTAAKGLNAGVLYLLVMPFLFATAYFVLYKKRKHELKKYQESQDILNQQLN